jgi:CBS domain-containing protein
MEASMVTDYRPLAGTPLNRNTTYYTPAYLLPDKVKLDYPALDVMTDLRRVEPVTIEPAASIEAANSKMIQHGVRLLLVVEAHKVVAGVITATDILGEKPLQFIQRTGVKHSEILVRDIMTPLEDLEAVRMDEVYRAKVGDIVATLQKAGRQHTLVVDTEEGSVRIRGIFSISQIARQLGVTIQTPEIARTFSEIEQELVK